MGVKLIKPHPGINPPTNKVMHIDVVPACSTFLTLSAKLLKDDFLQHSGINPKTGMRLGAVTAVPAAGAVLPPVSHLSAVLCKKWTFSSFCSFMQK